MLNKEDTVREDLINQASQFIAFIKLQSNYFCYRQLQNAEQTCHRNTNLLGAPQSTQTSFPSVFLIDSISKPFADELLLPRVYNEKNIHYVVVNFHLR